MVVDFDKVDTIFLDNSYLSLPHVPTGLETGIWHGGLTWLNGLGHDIAKRSVIHIGAINRLIEECDSKDIKFCVIPESAREIAGRLRVYHSRISQITDELGTWERRQMDTEVARESIRLVKRSRDELNRLVNLTRKRDANSVFGNGVFKYFGGYLNAAKAYFEEIKEEDRRAHGGFSRRETKLGDSIGTDVRESAFAFSCAHDSRIRGVLVLAADHHIVGNTNGSGILQRINERVINGVEGSKYGVTHFPEHEPFVVGYRGDIGNVLGAIRRRGYQTASQVNPMHLAQLSTPQKDLRISA
jgi:hypothetical protein